MSLVPASGSVQSSFLGHHLFFFCTVCLHGFIRCSALMIISMWKTVWFLSLVLAPFSKSIPIIPTVWEIHLHLTMPPISNSTGVQRMDSYLLTHWISVQPEKQHCHECMYNKGCRMGIRPSAIMGACSGVSTVLLFLCLELSLKSQGSARLEVGKESWHGQGQG